MAMITVEICAGHLVFDGDETAAAGKPLADALGLPVMRRGILGVPSVRLMIGDEELMRAARPEIGERVRAVQEGLNSIQESVLKNIQAMTKEPAQKHCEAQKPVPGELEHGAQTIASVLQSWLDWHAKGFSGEPSDERCINDWQVLPPRGMLKEWIKLLRRLGEASRPMMGRMTDGHAPAPAESASADILAAATACAPAVQNGMCTAADLFRVQANQAEHSARWLRDVAAQMERQKAANQVNVGVGVNAAAADVRTQRHVRMPTVEELRAMEMRTSGDAADKQEAAPLVSPLSAEQIRRAQATGSIHIAPPDTAVVCLAHQDKAARKLWPGCTIIRPLDYCAGERFERVMIICAHEFLSRAHAEGGSESLIRLASRWADWKAGVLERKVRCAPDGIVQLA